MACRNISFDFHIINISLCMQILAFPMSHRILLNPKKSRTHYTYLCINANKRTHWIHSRNGTMKNAFCNQIIPCLINFTKKNIFEKDICVFPPVLIWYSVVNEEDTCVDDDETTFKISFLNPLFLHKVDNVSCFFIIIIITSSTTTTCATHALT